MCGYRVWSSNVLYHHRIGTGFEIPAPAQAALMNATQQTQHVAAPPIATQCFMLSNMFDPTS